jgi:hypothetical protein
MGTFLSVLSRREPAGPTMPKASHRKSSLLIEVVAPGKSNFAYKPGTSRRSPVLIRPAHAGSWPATAGQFASVSGRHSGAARSSERL